MSDFVEKESSKEEKKNESITSTSSTETEQAPVVSEFKVCGTKDCPHHATLACPTCIKLGLPHALFCSQACFQKSWGTHKLLHAAVKATRENELYKTDPSRMPTEFKDFPFTGPLRPYQKTPKRTVPDHISKPDYATHPKGVSQSEERDKRTNTSIPIYTAEEIAGIREACRIGREVLDIASAALKVGVTCDEIDRIVHEATIERNAYPSPLNYYEFPKSVCTSVNEVICHGIPDMREIQNGDIVNLDISVYYNGFHSDLNETFIIGGENDPAFDSSRNLLQTAYNCLAKAAELIKPGALYRDFGDAISKIAKQNGCSVVQTYCGHGIGRLFHTVPTIPHYAKNKSKGVCQPGHIFTIEPMINAGSYRDVLWPDGWTAVTNDGKRSAQYEHTFLVTETGCEILTARPGDSTSSLTWNAANFQR